MHVHDQKLVLEKADIGNINDNFGTLPKRSYYIRRNNFRWTGIWSNRLRNDKLCIPDYRLFAQWDWTLRWWKGMDLCQRSYLSHGR
jgi:hypothetical protein